MIGKKQKLEIFCQSIFELSKTNKLGYIKPKQTIPKQIIPNQTKAD